tara:strand:+ start:25053 stop:25646 length:594 start_codon:yes stop_codon:yes gene_type:complete
MPPSKRDELVEAAMKVFYRNGFHNSGLDLIQSESGISRMTLYNHFKSKDELIVATLHRRDEIFRNQLMKFVDTNAQDPIERIMSVFDYHEEWFNQDNFQGCMFINASAEYCDPECNIRRVAAEHKLEIIRYITVLCTDANMCNPDEVAQQLNLLVEGAIVNAQVIGRANNNTHTQSEAAHRAKAMAHKIVQEAISES